MYSKDELMPPISQPINLFYNLVPLFAASNFAVECNFKFGN